MFDRKSLIRAVVALVAVVFAGAVEAAVIDANSHPRGLGRNAILDESQQLLWLDLNYTLGLSYNNAIAQTSLGGQFAGWRPATNAEALDLFQNAGLKLNGPGAALGAEAPGNNLMQIWGGPTTENDFNNMGVRGRQANFATSDQTIRNNERDFSFYWVGMDKGSIAEVAVSTVLPDTGYSHIAVALVRSAVPEPSGTILALLGLLATARRPVVRA